MFKINVMKKAFFITCFLSLFSGYACCQDMLTATISNIAVHDFQRERIRSEYEQEKIRLGKGGNKNSTTAPAIMRPLHVFLFEPVAGVSVSVRRAIVDDLKKKNPVSGNNLEAVLKRDDPYSSYVRYLKSRDLDVQHNYADAFTAYMLGMWRIANKLSADPSAAQIRAVRNQVAATLSVEGWTSRKKQEAAEYLLYDLIFANEPYEGSRKAGNKMQQQQDSDAVHNRFLKQNRMNLRGMTITQNGLVVIK